MTADFSCWQAGLKRHLDMLCMGLKLHQKMYLLLTTFLGELAQLKCTLLCNLRLSSQMQACAKGFSD